jgi:hypothetical protein
MSEYTILLKIEVTYEKLKLNKNFKNKENRCIREINTLGVKRRTDLLRYSAYVGTLTTKTGCRLEIIVFFSTNSRRCRLHQRSGVRHQNQRLSW